MTKRKRVEEMGPDAEMEKMRICLKEDNMLVASPENVEELSSRGYGTTKNGNLVLAFWEALFLVGKEMAEVEDEKTGKTVDFQSLLNRCKESNFWVKYLIYRDLRGRGYVVREGFGLGIDFRVYERGEYGTATAKYLIFGIQEGQPVLVEELDRALKYVHSLKKRLVLAVLNRRGEVVYYSLSQLTMK